jgi:hypothetical protein
MLRLSSLSPVHGVYTQVTASPPPPGPPTSAAGCGGGSADRGRRGRAARLRAPPGKKPRALLPRRCGEGAARRRACRGPRVGLGDQAGDAVEGGRRGAGPDRLRQVGRGRRRVGESHRLHDLRGRQRRPGIPRPEGVELEGRRRRPRPLTHLEEMRDEAGDRRLVGGRLGDAPRQRRQARDRPVATTAAAVASVAAARAAGRAARRRLRVGVRAGRRCVADAALPTAASTARRVVVGASRARGVRLRGDRVVVACLARSASLLERRKCRLEVFNLFGQRLLRGHELQG